MVYFLPKSEQSQDSVAGMSDSSSLQDVFMDPTSSQDSSHKVDPGKCSVFPEESNAIGKEKRATGEDNIGNDPNTYSTHCQVFRMNNSIYCKCGSKSRSARMVSNDVEVIMIKGFQQFNQ